MGRFILSRPLRCVRKRPGVAIDADRAERIIVLGAWSRSAVPSPAIDRAAARCCADISEQVLPP